MLTKLINCQTLPLFDQILGPALSKAGAFARDHTPGDVERLREPEVEPGSVPSLGEAATAAAAASAAAARVAEGNSTGNGTLELGRGCDGGPEGQGQGEGEGDHGR